MNRISIKPALFLLLFLFVISMGTRSLLYAAEKNTPMITVVAGMIQNVSNDSIVVNDKRYSITGVPILTLSGEPATKDQLKRGMYADIYFQERAIIKVLIHEPLPS